MEKYTYACPVLAPLRLVEKNKDDWRIVIDYSDSINQYGEGKEQLYTQEKFLDEEECKEYLDGELSSLKENGSCYRYIQKIGDVYYYLHNVLAEIDYSNALGYDYLGILNFKGKGDYCYLIREESFDFEDEFEEYMKSKAKSNVLF